MPQQTSPANLRPRRMPELMSSERVRLDELFASTVLAHVGVIVDGRAISMPTAFAVIDNRIVIHGSTGSRWMRALENQDASVSVTRVSGILVARSMFESSILYESAVVFGRFSPVPAERHEDALMRFTDRILPGRSRETRPSKRKELAATRLLEMPIAEWSLRISEGMPEDGDEDVAGRAWGGAIRFDRLVATAHPSPDLSAGIPLPESVAAFLSNPRGVV